VYVQKPIDMRERHRPRREDERVSDRQTRTRLQMLHTERVRVSD
jgi:hypothetical protein